MEAVLLDNVDEMVLEDADSEDAELLSTVLEGKVVEVGEEVVRLSELGDADRLADSIARVGVVESNAEVIESAIDVGEGAALRMTVDPC